MFNWTINVADLAVLIGAALLVYGRIVAIETKIKPIWEWWNSTRQIGERSGDEAFLINRRKARNER